MCTNVRRPFRFSSSLLLSQGTPRVPRLGIQPMTYWMAGRRTNHWATPHPILSYASPQIELRLTPCIEFSLTPISTIAFSVFSKNVRIVVPYCKAIDKHWGRRTGTQALVLSTKRKIVNQKTEWKGQTFHLSPRRQTEAKDIRPLNKKARTAAKGIRPLNQKADCSERHSSSQPEGGLKWKTFVLSTRRRTAWTTFILSTRQIDGAGRHSSCHQYSKADLTLFYPRG